MQENPQEISSHRTDLLPLFLNSFLSCDTDGAGCTTNVSNIQLFIRVEHRATIQAATGDQKPCFLSIYTQTHHSLWDTGSSVTAAAGSAGFSLPLSASAVGMAVSHPPSRPPACSHITSAFPARVAEFSSEEDDSCRPDKA